jgi:hypothetical protein
VYLLFAMWFMMNMSRRKRHAACVQTHEIFIKEYFSKNGPFEGIRSVWRPRLR